MNVDDLSPSEVLMMLKEGILPWWEDADGFVLLYDEEAQVYRFGPADTVDWREHKSVDPRLPEFADQLHQIKMEARR